MADRFLREMRSGAPTEQQVRERQWVYVPYDRLHDAVGPLATLQPRDAGIVLVESREKAMRRPYHKKKLTLLLANERHFALEQQKRGVAVIYWATRESIDAGLRAAQAKYKLPELLCNEPAERELRLDLERGIRDGLKMRFETDTAWLSTAEDFDVVYGRQHPRAHYLMDRFYRHMRQKTGVLMQAGKPVGGKYSMDAENRRPYRGDVPVPERPCYAPDAITAEVMELVEREFPQHFGTLEGFDLPVTESQARSYWKFCLAELLENFGPYEDAMAEREPMLFHTNTSALLNLTRLRAQDLVTDVAATYEKGKLPLASAEGFIRQILGWREYMRHIHRVTDGYRKLPGYAAKSRDAYSGAQPNALAAKLPLSSAYWGAESGLHCVDTVVRGVVRDGWSHHITRLMVLSNLATLCGFSPRELTDWFWIAYVDAYDWVVEPNVLGMGTFSDGGLTATKPYVSGAAYINKMSDYCPNCRFDPKKTTGEGSCPFTALYWTFLERNERELAGNIRMAMPLNSLRKKTAKERAALRLRASEAIAELKKSRT